MKITRYIIIAIAFGMLIGKGFCQTLPDFNSYKIVTQNCTYYGYSTDSVWTSDGRLNPDYVAPAEDGLFDMAACMAVVEDEMAQQLADNPSDVPFDLSCYGSQANPNYITGTTTD